MKEYQVDSKWVGWGGGFGSERDIAARMNRISAGGWSLVRTEITLCRWWWFVPRYKMHTVFERPMSDVTAREILLSV